MKLFLFLSILSFSIYGQTFTRVLRETVFKNLPLGCKLVVEKNQKITFTGNNKIVLDEKTQVLESMNCPLSLKIGRSTKLLTVDSFNKALKEKNALYSNPLKYCRHHSTWCKKIKSTDYTLSPLGNRAQVNAYFEDVFGREHRLQAKRRYFGPFAYYDFKLFSNGSASPQVFYQTISFE